MKRRSLELPVHVRVREAEPREGLEEHAGLRTLGERHRVRVEGHLELHLDPILVVEPDEHVEIVGARGVPGQRDAHHEGVVVVVEVVEHVGVRDPTRHEGGKPRLDRGVQVSPVLERRLEARVPVVLLPVRLRLGFVLALLCLL